jgi:hypothetical protein
VTVMIPLLLIGMAARWVWVRVHRRRAEPAPGLLDDTQEFDIVEDAFNDYRRLVHDLTVSELLDLADDRREFLDQLGRDLDADTDEWVAEEFSDITRRLKRDLRFRLALRAAARSTTTT